MAIRGSVKSGAVTVAPGKHRARCVGVIDMGLVEVGVYGSTTGETKLKHRVYLNFEVESGGLVGCEFTLSYSTRSNLGVDLANWLHGNDWPVDERDEFDLGEVLGKYCQVKVGVTQGGNSKLDHGSGGLNAAIFPATGDEWQTRTDLTLFDEGALVKGNIDTIPKFIADVLSPPSEEPWS